MSTLLVASTGGHLTELHHLLPRLVEVGSDLTWVTFDTPQSRNLLSMERVLLVEPTTSRDYVNVLRNVRPALRLIRDNSFERVISTGAAIALSFLPIARALGAATYYIESATRTTGPSTTGKLLARVPGIQLFSQHRSWSDRRWIYGGSVFDGYAVTGARPGSVRRVVVTLGAHESFGFRRLVDQLVEILPPEAEVLWQTGSTDVLDLGIDARPLLPYHELLMAVREADVVISHAGIGSILAALDAGKCPVIVPRDPRHGEHVDDHQLQIANELAPLPTSVVREVHRLELDDLIHASTLEVGQAPDLPPIVLDQL